eukprot:TRINITY_DN23270_c0_g2_i1.p1 TRINITY_DN23270_c0_g2~~TRINITY_DN23270_c0_g2_i1.p1  ORF type:complete len:561 (+),score=73.27 TRINITY_DN23270_c0_g2_i1:63-1685(+)
MDGRRRASDDESRTPLQAARAKLAESLARQDTESSRSPSRGMSPALHVESRYDSDADADVEGASVVSRPLAGASRADALHAQRHPRRRIDVDSIAEGGSAAHRAGSGRHRMHCPRRGSKQATQQRYGLREGNRVPLASGTARVPLPAGGTRVPAAARPRHGAKRSKRTGSVGSSASRSRTRRSSVTTKGPGGGVDQPCEDNCYAYCLAMTIDVNALEASWKERMLRRATAPMSMQPRVSDAARSSPPPPETIVVSLNQNLKLMKVGLRDCFVFDFGCLVCWGCNPDEAAAARAALKPYLKEPKESADIEEDGVDFEQRDLKSFEVWLSCRAPPTFERASLAYALAQSVRLGSLEMRVERWISRTRTFPEQLAKHGHTNIKGREVTRMMGELFALRHEVNLETDILDTPDLFWDYSDYVPLYRSARGHLDVDRRVEVLNKRFEVLQDLFDALEAELTERHATRLEWVVIVLCALEALVMALRLYANLSLEPIPGSGGVVAGLKPLMTRPIFGLASLSLSGLQYVGSVLGNAIQGAVLGSTG